MTRDIFPPATLSVVLKNKSDDFVDNRVVDTTRGVVVIIRGKLLIR